MTWNLPRLMAAIAVVGLVLAILVWTVAFAVLGPERVFFWRMVLR